MKIYRVGGVVRDRLLGRTSKDCDYVVVGSTPEEMLRLGYKQVGADFPVFLHPQSHEEYALARTERKQGSGYKGFIVHAAPDVTLEDDLRRRDLTINAMAETAEGEVIDPFDGREDLSNRLLRHVSPAFVEDPLRVLRVARFAARFDFTVVDETMALMRAMAHSGELDSLTPERVFTETRRALGEPYPARFFQVLCECDALAVLFPEIDGLFGKGILLENAETDAGLHTLHSLCHAAALGVDEMQRYALLLLHTGAGDRDVNAAQAFCRRWRAPNDWRDLSVLCIRHRTVCDRALSASPEELLVLLQGLDGFRRGERAESVFAVCELNWQAGHPAETAAYPQRALLQQVLRAAAAQTIADLAAQGHTGPQLAESIRERRLAAIAGVLRR
ncbi:MAG: multifunctional CCA addition/repair protein [Gammaproteobacteria bacterium]|nr:multifunctional CCA addition/repair protein [Gammaproteobacteria bacterium]